MIQEQRLKTCDLDTIGFQSKFENIAPILNSIRVKGKFYPYVNDNVDLKILPKNIKILYKNLYRSNLQDYNQTHFLNYIKNVKNFLKLKKQYG